MRNEYFLQAIKEVKEMGFRVYVNEKDAKNPTYCFIEDEGGNVGYMQPGGCGGVLFSTVHKLNKEVGAGFCLQMWDEAIYNVTKDDVLNSFTICPRWATRKQRANVVKYKNFAEYQSLDKVLKYVEI